MRVLINIDVPDLDEGIAFYTAALSLTVKRKLFGGTVAELQGDETTVQLLAKAPGSIAVEGISRRYERHWTPVHLDVLVANLEDAVARAISAGAKLETAARTFDWGRLATFSDPFGNGFCLVELSERGYDAAQ